ncbi:unnamed protein product, partial [Phaeothamnion confervicola]
QRSRLQFDEEALYSVTDQHTADLITQMVLSLPGVDPAATTVVDSTACVGGNTISFAAAFDAVMAVELDSARFRMLRHNVAAVGRADRVTFLNADFLSVLGRPELCGAVVFLDPPWGGPVYKESGAVPLFLSGVPLAEVCRRLRGRARYVVLKVPTN